MRGLGFSQNTTNFDVSRKFDKLNVAFEQNTEMRISKKKDSLSHTIPTILTEV
jgi:hypothetical protein